MFNMERSSEFSFCPSAPNSVDCGAKVKHLLAQASNERAEEERHVRYIPDHRESRAEKQP
jgi:hypothetical protein